MRADLAQRTDLAALSGLSQTPYLLCDCIIDSGQLAFVRDGSRRTRACLTADAALIAVWLVRVGVLADKVVALHTGNGPEIALAYLACFQLGAIAVPLNLRFKTTDPEDVPLHHFLASTEGADSCTLGLQASTVGRSIPGIRIRLVDPEERPVARGKPGKLLLRDPHGAPSVSHANDPMVRGGSNIFPVNVQHVWASHPDVCDAPMVGVSISLLGQAVLKFIQLRKGTRPEQLRDMLHAASQRLANYKPSECLPPIAFFPRNSRGKSDRTQVFKRQNHSGDLQSAWRLAVPS